MLNARFTLTATTLTIALLIALPASAADFRMYGAEFRASGRFYEVDVVGATVSILGNTNAFLSAMDFSPSGVLFSASSTLWEVDPATGIASNQRSIQFTGGTGGDILTGMAFSPSGELFGIGNGNGNLWRIDPVTAIAGFIGSSGESMFSLEFGPGGKLYGAGHDLFDISTLDGSGTLIGRVGDGALLNALDYAANGVMYGASGNITTDSLYIIDLSTGAGSLVGPTGADLVSLASIPEPATLSLLAVGAVALIGRARRKHASDDVLQKGDMI